MKGSAMKTITKCLFAVAIVPLALVSAASDSGTARAGNGAAFLGGMITSHVVGGFVRRDRARTQAEMDRTYAQPAPAPRPAPAAAKTSEQKLNELDDLARKGYVTKDEYKARRKDILDSG
jgi:hypothetical protein